MTDIKRTYMKTLGGKRRRFHIFKCESCGVLFERRADCLGRGPANHCNSCVHRKRPFESLYNSLYNDWRGTPVELTYEEFVTFTMQQQCHYCGQPVPWAPYGTVGGKFINRAYHLDRKDHTQPYRKDNCVVCCTICNRLRSNKFTYTEFVQIGKLLVEIYRDRNEGGS